MNLNSLLSMFSPKGDNFFPLFDNAAESLTAISAQLLIFVNMSDQQKMFNQLTVIKECKQKADDDFTAIFHAINKSFITPFDREDIQMMTDRMETVSHLIRSVAKRIMMYNPKKLPDSIIKLAEAIDKGTLEVQTAVKNLKKFKKHPTILSKQCTHLKSIEHQADDIYEHYISYLFENEKDAVELLKMKEIASDMEVCVDAIWSVGNAFKTIEIKYS